MELCVLWLQKKAADIVHHGLDGLRGQTAPQAAAVLGDTDEFVPHQHVQVVGNGALGDAQLLGQLLPAAVLLLQQLQDIQTALVTQRFQAGQQMLVVGGVFLRQAQNEPVQHPGDDGDVVVAGEEAHGVEGHDAGQKGDALVGQRLGLGKGAHKTGGVLPCLLQTLPQQTVRLRRLHHLCQQGGGLLHDAAGGALVLLQMGVQRQQPPPVGRGQAGEVHVVDEVADGVQLLRRGEGVLLILAHGGNDVPQPLLGCVACIFISFFAAGANIIPDQKPCQTGVAAGERSEQELQRLLVL